MRLKNSDKVCRVEDFKCVECLKRRFGLGFFFVVSQEYEKLRDLIKFCWFGLKVIERYEIFEISCKK